MTDKPRMDFGYNPPTGERGLETIRPRDYLPDLHRSLDVASQGFSSLWISDHINYGSEFRMECWTLLTWIAARYPGPKLGTIVMSNSFRSPSMMAKMGATLQHLSSGRFILGYGAGWHEGEYRAFGFDYPSPGVRIDMLEEGVQVIRRLWNDAPANFDGRFYRVEDAHCEPLPDPPPPIMIGGAGERKTLRVVARHADWWNDLARPAGRDPPQARRPEAALRGGGPGLRLHPQDLHDPHIHRPRPREGPPRRRGLARQRPAAHRRRPAGGHGPALRVGRDGLRPVHIRVPQLPDPGRHEAVRGRGDAQLRVVMAMA